MQQLFLESPDNIFKKHNVQAAFLFGSQSSDRAKPDSDYDIALIVQNKRTAPLFEILKDLQKVFIKPDKLDLVLADFRYSTPLLLFEITKGQVLYEKETGLAMQIKARAMHIYYDDEHRRKLKYEYIRREYAN